MKLKSQHKRTSPNATGPYARTARKSNETEELSSFEALLEKMSMEEKIVETNTT